MPKDLVHGRKILKHTHTHGKLLNIARAPESCEKTYGKVTANFRTSGKWQERDGKRMQIPRAPKRCDEKRITNMWDCF